MMPTALYGRSSRSVMLSAAVGECADLLGGAIALLYSPARCYLCTVDQQGNCQNETGRTIDYASIFEARLFTEQCEFRWLNNYEGYGRAVLLSENNAIESNAESLQLSDYLEDDLDVLQAIDTLKQSYLLWGEGVETNVAESLPQSWSELAAARIGRLSVPIGGIGKGQTVRLIAREYLAIEPKFGNVSVVEERLLKMEPLDIVNA